MLRGPGVVIRPLDPQTVHDLEENLRVGLGYFLGVPLFVDGDLDDLVIDIGNVDHVSYLKSRTNQVFSDDIKIDLRTGVADVDIPVNRGPADIHFDPGWVEGNQLFFFTAESVGDFQ
jgi:hypothetical protein